MRSIRFIGLTVAAVFLLTIGCGGGGSTQNPAVQPPAGLTYSTDPAIYTKNSPIATNVPTVGGGAISVWSVSPPLPVGLAINQTTGAISGTPTAITPVAIYRVTATNAGGSATASLSITVNDAAPSGLSYLNNPAIYAVGVTIPANAPSSSGGAIVSYAATPALSTGLSLNSSTGVITGTPTIAKVSTVYIITATNTGGTAATSLTIAVNDLAPSISYGSGSYAFTTNVPITPLTPSNSGGPVVAWSISPNLPIGLTFNSTNGTISGTPSAITPSTVYLVTASNTGGNCSVAPIIAVNPPAPIINTQPSNQIVSVGQKATFTVVASGTGPINYCWSKNGTLIPDATLSSYTTPFTVLTDTGALFTVQASDTYGQSILSTGATLTVTEGGFTATGSMIKARYRHTATVLQNGKVLIAGGADSSVPAMANVELYDPTTRTYLSTGSMTNFRMNHTATLLPNGKVLLIGGNSGGANLSSAELYDPTNGTFTATGSMTEARSSHTATLLADGTVVVIGGFNYPTTTAVGSAEIYNPATGAFSRIGARLSAPRFGHTATLLPSGNILIAGGRDYNRNDLASAELYSPQIPGSFSTTGIMVKARFYHTATLLSDSKVLMTAGISGNSAQQSAEVYDPTQGTFSATGSVQPDTAFWGHSSVLLPNGKVLVLGGWNGTVNISTAQIFDPTTAAFMQTGSMISGRENQSAVLMQNGEVLVSGGYGATGALANSEVYK